MLLLTTLAHGDMTPATLDLGGGAPRTAKAIRAAAASLELGGNLWLGKLRGVGGGRDTLVYVPSTIDTKQTIELVIYMEGMHAFEDHRMKVRHIAPITRLRGNSVYVAPDSPSSSLGTGDSKNEYWRAGCADRTCGYGYAASGDFVVFLDEVRTQLATMTGVSRDGLDLRLSIVGFSRGGKGIRSALQQLTDVDFVVGGRPVRIAEVIYADGNYNAGALDESWKILAARPEAPRMTVLVEAGAMDIARDNNRGRALAFWKRAARGAPLPTADKAASAPRLQLIPVPGGHHAIGNAAVDFLGGSERVANGGTT
jgi:hypothetical protein